MHWGILHPHASDVTWSLYQKCWVSHDGCRYHLLRLSMHIDKQI
jgi:hypothetical protein